MRLSYIGFYTLYFLVGINKYGFKLNFIKPPVLGFKTSSYKYFSEVVVIAFDFNPLT